VEDVDGGCNASDGVTEAWCEGSSRRLLDRKIFGDVGYRQPASVSIGFGFSSLGVSALGFKHIGFRVFGQWACAKIGNRSATGLIGCNRRGLRASVSAPGRCGCSARAIAMTLVEVQTSLERILGVPLSIRT